MFWFLGESISVCLPVKERSLKDFWIQALLQSKHQHKYNSPHQLSTGSSFILSSCQGFHLSAHIWVYVSSLHACDTGVVTGRMECFESSAHSLVLGWAALWTDVALAGHCWQQGYKLFPSPTTSELLEVHGYVCVSTFCFPSFITSGRGLSSLYFPWCCWHIQQSL